MKRILNEDALARRLDLNDISVALDVWNSEPIINLSLMEKVDIATPHILVIHLKRKSFFDATRCIFAVAGH